MLKSEIIEMLEGLPVKPSDIIPKFFSILETQEFINNEMKRMSDEISSVFDKEYRWKETDEKVDFNNGYFDFFVDEKMKSVRQFRSHLKHRKFSLFQILSFYKDMVEYPSFYEV